MISKPSKLPPLCKDTGGHARQRHANQDSRAAFSTAQRTVLKVGPGWTTYQYTKKFLKGVPRVDGRQRVKKKEKKLLKEKALKKKI